MIPPIKQHDEKVSYAPLISEFLNTDVDTPCAEISGANPSSERGCGSRGFIWTSVITDILH